MKPRLHFKLIGLMIISALIGLIVFQGYWLKGLYGTLYSQMESDIREAMRIADYKEIFYRMEEYKQKRGDGEEYKGGISFGQVEVEARQDSLPSAEKLASVDVGEIDLTEIDLKEEVETALNELLSALNSLEEIILQGMHDQFDSIAHIQFENYDRFLVDELKARNIHAHYQVYLVFEAQKNHQVFRTLSKSHPAMAPDTATAVFDWKDASYYDYPVRMNPKYLSEADPTISDPFSYRLYIKSPSRIVFRQMTGILLTSFLLLLIILVAFLYLLRTIMRQKTEEELKTDFTNNMTHELKTPISISYAAVDSLLHFGDPVNEKQRKYLTIVKEQLTGLAGLVEQILTLSVENRSTFKLHPVEIELKELIVQLQEQWLMKTKQHIRFSTDIPDGLTVMADKTHLYNIINNLIDNAVKYNNKEMCEITIGATKEQEEIRISLSDNGPGISQAHQSRIFDRFYRIPSGNLHNVKGHGLGLFYVKDMMKKQGGDVTVESQSGKGSTFHLILKG
ncbi:signal transduction histidine kinase [Parabacteroides sp. PFB2-10]|uniref:sensor histidine kinase n=1 Tax=Parabacteroides sp. PFB2-10 TaxID=1742405 RepID=UPI0024734F2E|nr:HAMP domain-containing sensor histidine kinase [Parabacteroides sp. PFB2-10]MDH6312116.1 signal transduction histidine kinase [Parabacteroides sp. PFB2-10]MDL2244610.1 HAMP domain-containing histidine kinase [Parabacteroides sp. OttesenSCG-928-J18]